MVTHSGTEGRAHRLRPLNEPQPVEVEADAAGRPVAIALRGQRLRVLRVQDAWRIDDEWWHERPVSRLYWQAALEDGRVVTVFHDLVEQRWAQQSY